MHEQGAEPVFVAGFRRSGTTLLQALIGSHPRIATPPEMHFLARIAGYRTRFDLNDDDQLTQVIRAVVWPGYPPMDECEFDQEAIFRRLQVGPRTFAGVLDAVMRDFMERQGKQRWCEKTPAQRPSLIWQHFPDAQVVHIVRDPRDTVASSLAMPGSPWPDGATTALAWRKFTERSLFDGAHKGPAQYFRLRYEDLTRNPEAVMSLVFAFLGEPFDPALLSAREARSSAVPAIAQALHGRVLEDIEPTSAGQWRERLPARDRLRIAPVVAPLLPGLAYEQPRRATVWAGRLVNAVYAPLGLVRSLLQRWRTARLRSPEERLEAEQELVHERLRRYQERIEQAERSQAAGRSA